MIDTIPDTQPTTDRQRREMLYRAFEEHVDPKTYDGCNACLIDQTAMALRGDDGHQSSVGYLAGRFGVDTDPLYYIFAGVVHDEYRFDYAAAMRLAREELGLT